MRISIRITGSRFHQSITEDQGMHSYTMIYFQVMKNLDHSRIRPVLVFYITIIFGLAICKKTEAIVYCQYLAQLLTSATQQLVYVYNRFNCFVFIVYDTTLGLIWEDVRL